MSAKGRLFHSPRTSTMRLGFVAIVMLTFCEATFIQPQQPSDSLAKNVTASCTGSNDCTPTMNTTQCSSEKVCTLTCPTTSRTDFPDMKVPLTSWPLRPVNGSIGCQLSTDAPPPNAPSAANNSNGLLEVNSSSTGECSVSNTSAQITAGRLALSLWVLPQCTRNCTLGRIGSTGQSAGTVELFMSDNKLCVNSFCNSSPFMTWTHIVLQISGDKASFAVDGVLGSSGLQTITIPDLPQASGNTTVSVGTSGSLQSDDSYQLYDVRYYSDILTAREIKQVFTNSALESAGQLSECRCPHTHLTLKAGDPYTCVDSDNKEEKRVNTVFNPPRTLLDGDGDTTLWAGPDNGSFTLTVSLHNKFQVERVAVGFQTNVPSSLMVLVDLPVSESNNLTCAGQTCSFDLNLNTATVSPDIFARHVVESFNLIFLPRGQQVQSNIVLASIAVTGRCNCNGNAPQCNMSVTPYLCDCDSGTNTEGEYCQNCISNKYHQDSQFSCMGTCDCEAAGAINTSQTCNVDNGVCQCKANVEGARCDACKYWTYHLNTSNPQGCVQCACHQNGSERCDNMTGVCSCKSNVMGSLCNACQDGYYDDGPAVGPDVCKACGCIAAGSNLQICDNNTGQCSCKGFVQGRTCNECKDGYHSLQITHPKGCLSCGCNLVGSISDTCNKTTGQCPCKNGVPVNSTCSPHIQSVEPRYGPLAGGTRVTIRGQLLGSDSQQPTVFLDNLTQAVVEHNISVIVFSTSNYSTTKSVPMKISWSDDPSPVSGQPFEYRPNPSLDRSVIPDVAMFVSGGCDVRFKGSNFNSVAVPQLSVRNPSGSTVYSSCRHVQQELRCASPNLTGLPNLGVANLRFGLHLDGIPYPDLGPVTVNPDPKFDDMGSYDLQYPFEMTVTLTGSGLTGGCDRGEISILIGVVSCDIVSLSDSEIECEPPKTLRGSKDQPIMVKMGSNIAHQVGTLNYLRFWETTYFIGIMCGVGALILLIVVIVIFCLCRRRRTAKTSRPTSHIPLVEKASNGNTAVQNQYSELPGQGITAVNHGFQDPIQAQTVIREPKDAPPPTAREMDVMSEFLHRVEPSLGDAIKSAVVSSNDLTLGRVCTNRGTYARIIDGQFATQTAGQRREKKVTIKTLKDSLSEEGMLPMWATAALRECLRLHRHTDDNVLSIIGLAVDKDRFHMIYPYMQNRTLKDHIVDANKEFSVRQLVEFGLQVAEGLAYLHSKDLAHKDLASRNCMVDAESMVKVCDAAFTWDFYGDEYMYDKVRERYMPLRWMAPESLLDGYYDMRTDVWSLGVLLWELLTRGCMPFHEVEDGKVKNFVLEGYMLGKPDNCSDNVYEVMKECWAQENEHRPHTSSVVKLLGEELTGSGEEQEDVYVNLGTVAGYYENQNTINKARRKAPLPPPKV